MGLYFSKFQRRSGGWEPYYLQQVFSGEVIKKKTIIGTVVEKGNVVATITRHVIFPYDDRTEVTTHYKVDVPGGIFIFPVLSALVEYTSLGDVWDDGNISSVSFVEWLDDRFKGKGKVVYEVCDEGAILRIKAPFAGVGWPLTPRSVGVAAKAFVRQSVLDGYVPKSNVLDFLSLA